MSYSVRCIHLSSVFKPRAVGWRGDSGLNNVVNDISPPPWRGMVTGKVIHVSCSFLYLICLTGLFFCPVGSDVTI
jgi:hypothetical protein